MRRTAVLERKQTTGHAKKTIKRGKPCSNLSTVGYRTDYLLTKLSLGYLPYLGPFSEQERRPILASDVLLNSSYWNMEVELYEREKLIQHTAI